VRYKDFRDVWSPWSEETSFTTIESRQMKVTRLITEEAIGGVPVTVDDQRYVILTLKSRIDPITLEVTPDVLTNVYVEVAENYPVLDPETARKIGIIDYSRRIAEKAEEMKWNKQVLMGLQNVYVTLRLADLTTAAINIYVSGVDAIRDTKTIADALANIQTVKDFAQLEVPGSWSGLLTELVELAMRALIYDPMKELENDLRAELSQAIESYTSVLGLLEKGEITDYSAARSFLSSYMSAESHREQTLYLFKKFLDNYKLFIAKLICGLATGGLSNFAFLVKEAMDSLDWTIELLYRQIVSSYENFATLNYKLLASAEYTLELAGTPSELINEYKINYLNYVNDGYEEAAKAVEKVVTPMLPFFMRISRHSSAELRVYDVQGRVTGLVNGEEKNEILYSIYYENTVIILSSTDSYRYEVVGTEEESYGLEVERISFEDNETITFTSTGIPTSANAIHQYTINWTALSMGEEGVTVLVDSDGDGVFEHIFTSDGELTQSEYVIATDSTPPTTTLIIGEPKYLAEITYVTPDTPFILEANDGEGSGVYLTSYRIRNSNYNTGWLLYTEPFNLTGLTDGVYTIEFNSTDYAGNVEATNTIQVTLFSWNYVFRDSYGRGTTLKINLAHKFFQFITPDKDYGMRNATYMRVYKRAIIIYHKDNELKLATISIDTQLDFCIAYAKDNQTGKEYWLIDKAGTE